MKKLTGLRSEQKSLLSRDGSPHVFLLHKSFFIIKPTGFLLILHLLLEYSIAMSLFDIEKHLVFYRSYHFNQKNVAIHLMCIPIILLSAITFSSVHNILGDDYPQVNLGSLLAWSYGIFYILNDWKVGVPTGAFITVYAYLAKHVYQTLNNYTFINKEQFVHIAVIAHVVSWLAQFYGHAVFEKRSPALLDNLLQALVLAPFFVSFEVAFWLGYRPDLKKKMDNQAGIKVREFRAKSKREEST